MLCHLDAVCQGSPKLQMLVQRGSSPYALRYDLRLLTIVEIMGTLSLRMIHYFIYLSTDIFAKFLLQAK